MDIIKDLTLEYLVGTPVGQGFEKAVSILQKIQENAVILAGDDENEKLTAMKAGTILILGVLKKVSEGRLPKDFTPEDFGDIANTVSEQVIMKEGQEYSIFVFRLYERYIEYSATELMKIAPEEKCDAMLILAKDLRVMTEQFQNGDLSELRYTEECLWICLDAMVKLLSTYAGSFTGPEAATLIEGVSSFAFEYGRLALYNRELALITEYLEKQKVLDKELQAKYSEYLLLLDKDIKQFTLLIHNAFDSDLRVAFTASAQLAKAAGVRQEEILVTRQRVDDYFIN